MESEMMFEKLRILVVDDQAEMREMLGHLLKELGVSRVIEAADGSQALALIREAPDSADLIVCDWNMPQVSGVDVLRGLSVAGSRIPLLMITGRADIDSVYEAKNRGAAAYIRKPFSLEELESKIRTVMARLPQRAKI